MQSWAQKSGFFNIRTPDCGIVKQNTLFEFTIVKLEFLKLNKLNANIHPFAKIFSILTMHKTVNDNSSEFHSTARAIQVEHRLIL